MAVRVVNLVIEQGTDFNNTFFLEDPVTNSQTNLAGTTAVAKMAKHAGSSSKTNFSVTITSAYGTIGIALTAGATSSLKPGRYVYDVLLTASDGTKTRVVEGNALVTAGICT